MLRSLVGSEMCIRDRGYIIQMSIPGTAPLPCRFNKSSRLGKSQQGWIPALLPILEFRDFIKRPNPGIFEIEVPSILLITCGPISHCNPACQYTQWRWCMQDFITEGHRRTAVRPKGRKLWWSFWGGAACPLSTRWWGLWRHSIHNYVHACCGGALKAKYCV